MYVQDLIARDSVRIWNLVEKQKAWVYISGYVFPSFKRPTLPTPTSRSSNKMPAAVKAAIQAAAVSEGRLSEPDAEKYITRMEWEGRLYEECWS